MYRYMIRQKVGRKWGYVDQNGVICSDLLNGMKFDNQKDVKVFMKKRKIELRKTTIDEVNFSYIVDCGIE